MIYYVKLDVKTKERLTDAIPTSIRHFMEITEKYVTSFSNTKHRVLTGWLTQKQFNRLVKDCVLKSVEERGYNKERRFAVKFVRRFASAFTEYTAYVEAYPQKYKRSKRVNKPVTMMGFKTPKQRQRMKRAILKRYA